MSPKNRQLVVAVAVLILLLIPACVPPSTPSSEAAQYVLPEAGSKVAISLGYLRIANLATGKIWDESSSCIYSHPSWAPNGRYLVATVNCGGDKDIDIYDTSSKKWQSLVAGPTVDSDPDWSPDGNRIVFVSEQDGNIDLYLVEVDFSGRALGEPKLLTENKGVDTDPAWSPDGRLIVYSSHQPGKPSIDLYVIDPADGSTRIINQTDSFDEFQPAWARGRIAYIAQQRDSDVTILEVAPIDATGMYDGIKLTWHLTGKSFSSPSWSADGTKLAYYSDEPPSGVRLVVAFDYFSPRNNRFTYLGHGVDTDFWSSGQ